jgi:hypothetical protein
LLAAEELMEINVGTLEKLKLVALAPKRKKSATDERRDKMVWQLTKQMKVVEAALGGPASVCKKAIQETDAEGNCKRVEAAAVLANGARNWRTALCSSQCTTVRSR